MRIRLTKMQGTGNDFIVLDETTNTLGLKQQHYRWLAHRHLGVGADQILTIAPPTSGQVDFSYRIHNADGKEVEHCGNGARCFVRYVHAKGLSHKNPLRVQTQKTIIELSENGKGEVSVNMGAPLFNLKTIPFAPDQLPNPHPVSAPNGWQRWSIVGQEVAVLSMGNPHAVLLCTAVERADIAAVGASIQACSAFPQGVNVGFLQVLSSTKAYLRVFERGVGETLSCGTGVCAAVVAGIRLGLLAHTVAVHTHGGTLRIEWAAGAQDALDLHTPVHMCGPAEFVFDAEVDVPEQPLLPSGLLQTQ